MKYTHYFEVRTGEQTRYESVSREDAERFASDLYRTEKVIPDIFMHKREEP